MQVGQTMLTTFYESVQFQYPSVADAIRADVQLVGLYGLSADKEPAREAADRLRRIAFDLPVIMERTLSSALQDLGYTG